MSPAQRAPGLPLSDPTVAKLGQVLETLDWHRTELLQLHAERDQLVARLLSSGWRPRSIARHYGQPDNWAQRIRRRQGLPVTQPHRPAQPPAQPPECPNRAPL